MSCNQGPLRHDKTNCASVFTAFSPRRTFGRKETHRAPRPSVVGKKNKGCRASIVFKRSEYGRRPGDADTLQDHANFNHAVGASTTEIRIANPVARGWRGDRFEAASSTSAVDRVTATCCASPGAPCARPEPCNALTQSEDCRYNDRPGWALGRVDRLAVASRLSELARPANKVPGQ